MSASSNHCQVLLAKLFHLLCDPENSRDWWFSLFHKDVTNLSQQKVFGSINYIPLNSLFEISNNDWILFLLDCNILKRRREQIILHLENLESFKLQNNLHFIHAKFYHKTYIETRRLLPNTSFACKYIVPVSPAIASTIESISTVLSASHIDEAVRPGKTFNSNGEHLFSSR